MPSPRFGRLPPGRRSEILAVARAHFARDGVDRASYNKIIADAGISKTTAYLYFDGKEDLIAAVRRDLYERLGQVMGPWCPAPSAGRFWGQLGEVTGALRAHLLAHPDDLAMLGQGVGGDEARGLEGWFGAVVDDGLRLGVIRQEVDRSLLLGATIAVFRALDEWALAALLRRQKVDLEAAWRLLAGLWGGEPPGEGAKPARRPSRRGK